MEPALFFLEPDSDGLWIRVTEHYSIMLCHTTTALGAFWVMELELVEEDGEASRYFIDATAMDPNLDKNITEFFREFTTALYSARLNLSDA